ncbi:MAG: cache domain-containing protein [Deltaproteobacteria bacterium]|nr:cache domain-containing protein [Deltaproteobacteria bacterium]
MEKGLYISDMFLGFRQEPHSVIAVVGVNDGKKRILRATVDTEVFRSLVENIRIGQTGEVYLVNSEGIFQTSPRLSGRIMEKCPPPGSAIHEDI